MRCEVSNGGDGLHRATRHTRVHCGRCGDHSVLVVGHSACTPRADTCKWMFASRIAATRDPKQIWSAATESLTFPAQSMQWRPRI